MKTTTRSLMILIATFTVGAPALEPSGCLSSLTLADVAAAMGAKVRVQPVFSDGALKGWRVYETRNSSQLSAQEIIEGSLMTHVCGIPAREIFAKGGDVCCTVDASREVQVTFKFSEHEKQFTLRRP